MVGLADQNERTYKSKYGTYNKENGFIITNWDLTNDFEDMLYDLFHEDLWSLKVEEKEMTKEEIEKALGYKIKIKNDVDMKNVNVKEDKPNKDINYRRIPDDIWSFSAQVNVDFFGLIERR